MIDEGIDARIDDYNDRRIGDRIGGHNNWRIDDRVERRGPRIDSSSPRIDVRIVCRGHPIDSTGPAIQHYGPRISYDQPPVGKIIVRGRTRHEPHKWKHQGTTNPFVERTHLYPP